MQGLNPGVRKSGFLKVWSMESTTGNGSLNVPLGHHRRVVSMKSGHNDCRARQNCPSWLKCRPWFHKQRKVVSAEHGALQSAEGAPQHAELVKITLLGFHTYTLSLRQYGWGFEEMI